MSSQWLRLKFSTGSLPGDRGQPVTRCVDKVGDVGRSHKAVVADADGATSEGGSYSFAL